MIKFNYINKTKIYFCFVMSLASCGYIAGPFSGQNGSTVEISPFLNKIVDFRNNTGKWPTSKNDLVRHGEEYQKVMETFPYENVDFVIKDNQNMILRYNRYKRKVQSFPDEKIIKPTSNGGEIKFYKDNNHFSWTRN